MATPQNQAGSQPFIPEVWSAAIMEPYQKALVYGQNQIVTSDYIGEIAQRGDTVHLTTISTPTIRSYDAATDLIVEDLETTGSTLAIDQGDYFAFRVEDVSAFRAAGPLKDPAINTASIALRDKSDTYMGNIFKNGAGSKLGAISVDPEKKNAAWNVLIKLRAALNSKSVPTTGRYVIVGPEFESALLLDERFTRVDASGNEQGLRNGIVGRALGFDVLVSSNAPKTAGREVVVAGVQGAAAFVHQINKIETQREELRFADLVKGLLIYGGGIVRPDGVATAEVKIETGATVTG